MYAEMNRKEYKVFGKNVNSLCPSAHRLVSLAAQLWIKESVHGVGTGEGAIVLGPVDDELHVEVDHLINRSSDKI